MLSPQRPSSLTSKPSRFLPSFAGERIGLVAGGGLLPKLVAAKARDDGWAPFVVTVADGRTEDWSSFDTVALPWSRTGDVFRHLRQAGAERVVFCGSISVRPDYRSMIPSLATLRMMPEIFRAVRGGDDSLLRGVSRIFERRGFVLHAVQELMPELLTPAGLLAGPPPSDNDHAALARARRASELLGTLDVGQAVVASAERVIALEAVEGTREMLLRVAALRRRGAIARKERCVLVKGVKPGQDLRFDLPSIGRSTIEEAAEAGLVGIGLSAETSLILGLEEVSREAGRRGLFVIGLGRATFEDGPSS